MKTTLKSALALLFLAIGLSAYAQNQGINYQATVRDASGSLITNQSVDVIFNIKEISASGNNVYSEAQTLTTNAYGGFVAIIGQGTPSFGVFNSIDWTIDSYFLNVNVNGDDLGTSQFRSVPFAFYSNEAAYAHDATDAEFADVAAEVLNPIWKKKQNNGDYFTEGKPVIIGDSIADAEGLTVSLGNVSSNSSELVDLIVDTLTSGKDVLNIHVGQNSSNNGQFIECSKGTSTNFKVNADGSIISKSSLSIDGKLKKASTYGADMTPIAYGRVNADGTAVLNATTGNVSVQRTSLGAYKVTINGVTPNSSDFMTIATRNSLNVPGFIYSNVGAGGIFFFTDDISGAHVDQGFNFIVYKP